MSDQGDKLDLYGLLGLARDATPAAIKCAYRKAAQAVHPDKPGGSEEKFKAVKLAFDILSDPISRGRYDDTGEYDPSGGSAIRQAAMKEIVDAMVQFYSSIVQSKKKAKHHKIVASLASILTCKKTSIDDALKLARAVRVELVDSQARFKCRNGENVLAAICEIQVKACDVDIKNMEDLRLIVVEAIDIVQRHDFDQELLLTSGQMPNYNGVFFKFSSGG